MLPNMVNQFTARTGYRFRRIEVLPCSTRYHFPRLNRKQVDEIAHIWREIAENNTLQECLCCSWPSDDVFLFTVITRSEDYNCANCGSPKCKRCQIRKNNEEYAKNN